MSLLAFDAATGEAEIRDNRLELSVLFAQLTKLANLRRSEAAKAAPPEIEGILVDTELAADLGDRRTGFSLPQRCGDLLGSS